ncbi:dephospho-CoA kinase [Clostridium sp. DJ247]|uniref:dephospho-CoA kinase n=1 Tax=Clostridium sp. DJ247 TaxID=2726188 RepID=UPI00162918FB|nr:dephospho-CoA kinase [Clostridium sp. DJ247]MBC2580607.1 dephospho-CoA kinase [Clostridium sp. DJ247]
MIKIGLTGGIGSGKSTISNMLKERKFTVIDADVVAREVLKIYPEILLEIKKEFGEKFFDEEGTLRRKTLGEVIFSNDEKRKNYEKIIMPFIKKEIFKRIDQCEQEGKQVCFVDGATLIENRVNDEMDTNILVYVDLESQIDRVKSRDNLTKEQVINRIKSQMPLEDKKLYVDFIIDNSGTIEETKINLDRTLKEIGKKYRGVECLKA